MQYNSNMSFILHVFIFSYHIIKSHTDECVFATYWWTCKHINVKITQLTTTIWHVVYTSKHQLLYKLVTSWQDPWLVYWVSLPENDVLAWLFCLADIVWSVWGDNDEFFKNSLVKQKSFKVPVKAILQKSSKHIINVTYVLLKHITKSVNCEVLNWEQQTCLQHLREENTAHFFQILIALIVLFTWWLFYHSNLAGWLITNVSVVWQTQNAYFILT